MSTKTVSHNKHVFDEKEVIHELKHFLPAQNPLKDFVHHNTLHAFQDMKFFEGIRRASEIFGYNVSLSLDEYRALYAQGRIREDVLDKILLEKFGASNVKNWKNKLVSETYEANFLPRIGNLRANWKKSYQIDLDSMVHPTLFRIICGFLDQGIAIWGFPEKDKGFLDSLKEMERNSYSSYFRGKRAKDLLLKTDCRIKDLLQILVGDESLYTQYLYDQQFAHQGWSGMVSAVEDFPETLLDSRKISLQDAITFELLLEIDAIDFHCGNNWSPLSQNLSDKPIDLFADVEETEVHKVLKIWQEAFEWTYYDEVLAGIKLKNATSKPAHELTFQAMFCIDDRECSIRRYLEQFDTSCETFGTPGFFGVEFFFQPEGGQFYTKVCPAPVTPKYLVKEKNEVAFKGVKLKKDLHFSKHSHSFYSGWLISQTLGFWSAVKLFGSIFRPSMSPATSSSFKHMDKHAGLTVQHTHHEQEENGLQVGFEINEMVDRVEGTLKSIGLVKDFAPIVYVVGHGASSVNNPHFAAYDCGACCGRAGSANARVLSEMANKPEVRTMLRERGIDIPDTTQFVGALHDTTRDEVAFFDEKLLSEANYANHLKYEKIFEKSLDYNAKERSRRFESIATNLTPAMIHEKIKIRSVSLFEPRPELNHATNALCIVGRRNLTKGLFLDRRSFLNSYDYSIDPEGKYLFNIMKAAAPVCGGINLEYYFSRVDNQKLGAGTKLPHNVMGLIGVANGIDGDLRPGLPSQMIEVHDPVRILFIVEHFPDVVLDTIKRLYATYEWFINEWVNLVVVNPETKELFSFQKGEFVPYNPLTKDLQKISDITPLLESTQDNFPVYLIGA
ncbi:hypothetical protein LV89_00932 [Arcicella aurantiaca]|uniref:Probable inorganic carbon transporter subunit DabA n=1 Tax=Arcicella aurantiaca TaxID=591202 RepID=A0A316ECB5_9BACT|nr:DUF2309 domain-containing protein [Arcicella aurantiaca]PWK28154.1 hypothetical protein LV89_00932 [Arcicella aurantiaca]